jgi:hypothetical protein
MIQPRLICEKRDVAGALLCALVICISIWQLALPLSRSVQDATLARFHLASPSFAGWALQQPIPSMYSFENRYWIIDEESNHTVHESKIVNHFPTRLFTFGDNRYRLLNEGISKTLVVRSRYRGNERVTLCRAIPSTTGGFTWESMQIPGMTLQGEVVP